MIRPGQVGPSKSKFRTPQSTASVPSSANITSFFAETVSGRFVSIVEGRGSARGEIGLASISLTNPTLVLCQFSDSRTYSRTLAQLTLFNPSEILVSCRP